MDARDQRSEHNHAIAVSHARWAAEAAGNVTRRAPNSGFSRWRNADDDDDDDIAIVGVGLELLLLLLLLLSLATTQAIKWTSVVNAGVAIVSMLTGVGVTTLDDDEEAAADSGA
jgi:hypothetical protein